VWKVELERHGVDILRVIGSLRDGSIVIDRELGRNVRRRVVVRGRFIRDWERFNHDIKSIEDQHIHRLQWVLV
jgi:hypothetical protein